MKKFDNKNNIYCYIADFPERVIEEIKSKDCVLNNLIEPMPDIDPVRPFIEYHYWADSESVNVFQVVGTAHSDYQGIPWIEMLQKGKRMPHNLEMLKKNPQYYFEARKKEPAMHYTRINDKIFISGEGNHRTSIAKVLFFFTGHTVLHGITFEEIKVDTNLLTKIKTLKNILLRSLPGIEVEVIRKLVKREDTAGWKKDYYKITLKIINHHKLRTIEIGKKEVEDFLDELIKFSQMNFIRRFFTRSFLIKGKLRELL
ncbi:MAG: hypothetical protein QXD54_05530 [Candidatus Aenigmatarchaeota archaeon]